MHTEVLSSKQIELIPYIAGFQRSFYMVGGTAIALHIGHRRSIDFDLFSAAQLSKTRIKGKLKQIPLHQVPVFEDFDQLHVLINGVKITFYCYPFPVKHPVKIHGLPNIPTLLSLAAMKAFALGRRAKWKDYVDLYFIIHDYYSLSEICKEAGEIFGQQFSEKLFRQQLSYHTDIDYTEQVEFLVPSVPDTKIKDFLTQKAIEFD